MAVPQLCVASLLGKEADAQGHQARLQTTSLELPLPAPQGLSPLKADSSCSEVSKAYNTATYHSTAPGPLPPPRTCRVLIYLLLQKLYKMNGTFPDAP